MISTDASGNTTYLDFGPIEPNLFLATHCRPSTQYLQDVNSDPGTMQEEQLGWRT